MIRDAVEPPVSSWFFNCELRRAKSDPGAPSAAILHESGIRRNAGVRWLEQPPLSRRQSGKHPVAVSLEVCEVRYQRQLRRRHLLGRAAGPRSMVGSTAASISAAGIRARNDPYSAENRYNSLGASASNLERYLLVQILLRSTCRRCCDGTQKADCKP